MISHNIYLNTSLKQIPRLLGLLNKNPLSKTYGCFDRQFWHYNTVDFPCARMQEATLTLALIYKTKNKDNIYYNNENILEWINASLQFWAKIQEKNGSFNEWYPKENSFVATSFGLYAISESILVLGKEIKKKSIIIEHVKKAADWILSKHEKKVLNQEAGAAIALYNTFLITNENKYKKAAYDKIRVITRNQTREGWFHEYGGADIGYLSLAIDYLSKFYKKTHDKRLKDALNKSIEFIKYFIHPDNTFGGEYGSRNTEYLIPHGFEIMSKVNPVANAISDDIKKSLSLRKTISPSTLDDRYLSYILYTYIQAFNESNNKINKVKLPYKKEFFKNFKIAKIAVISNKNFYFIINYSKGGALKILSKNNKKHLSDSGILAIDNKGKKLTTSFLNTVKTYKISANNIKISGKIKEFSDMTSSPIKNIALRTFQLSIGRNEKIGLYTKERLRNLLITKSKFKKNLFKRNVEIRSKEIIIEDIIDIKNLQKIMLGIKYSCIYVPSSRYFQVSDINTNSKLIEYKPKKDSKFIRIIRHIDHNCNIKTTQKYLNNIN